MENADMPIDTLVATDNLARTMRSEGVESTIKGLGGLTKREHFAAMAMQGLASACNSDGGWSHDSACAAKQAVEYADALLKELDK